MAVARHRTPKATPARSDAPEVAVLSTPLPPHKVGQRPQVWSRAWFLLGLPLVLTLALGLTEPTTMLTASQAAWPLIVLFSGGYVGAWALAAEFERFPTTRPGEALLFGAMIALLPVGLLAAVDSVASLPYFLEVASGASIVWLAAGVWFFQRRPRSRFAVLPGGSAYQLLRSVSGTHEVTTSGHRIPDRVDGIVADLHRVPDTGFQGLLAHSGVRGLPVYDAAYLYEMLTGCVLLGKTRDTSIEVRPPGPLYDMVKRSLDIGLILISAPITLPMMAITALAIKLDSPGPVLFRQERVGRHGRRFEIVKFRSMFTDAERNGAQFAGEKDDRITRVGRFIRKYRIDELPQFWNVLRGDMSLIGPRPEQVSFVQDFRNEIPYYPQRHAVRPGITGWAQVRSGYAASTRETRRKLAFDLYYVKYRSLALDLLIICLTLKTMVTGFGAR